MPDREELVRSTLASVFGFAEFRPGQQEIIEAVLGGESVLAVMPTGSGKSLCYQLPAILRGELTVVVSPLIALMRDQVRQLQAYGIAAASLNSANEPAENRRVQQALRERTLRLLYIAPERLARAESLAMLKTAGVSLLAIDEAHCVSQWGHDFRPEYLQLGKLAGAIGSRQILALTATADAPTRADILDKLFDHRPRTFIRSFDRPNLHLSMRPKAGARRQLADFLAARRGQSGIVYCATRKRTEELADALAAAGHRTRAYHAGMEQSRRDQNQDAFQREDGIVMVATVAFGMGIDKPDVRFVCHADLPQNIEAYYQEIGRAGRDGLPADTLTLYGLDDMRFRRLQIEEGEASEERKRIDRQRFGALIALCESPRCRRQALLAYFGEETGACGNCDLCQGGIEVFDGTILAQKAMSAMARTGERFGTEHLINLLTGNATDAIRRLHHDGLPTFGVGKDRDANSWRSVFRQIYAAGLVTLDIAGHGSWLLTERGRRVLRGQERVELRSDIVNQAPPRGRRQRQQVDASPLPAASSELLAALKALRRALAEEQRQPAYIVFSDRTLIEMAAKRPESLEAMRAVHGVGEAKLARYGPAFLAIVRAHGDDSAATPEKSPPPP